MPPGCGGAARPEKRVSARSGAPQKNVRNALADEARAKVREYARRLREDAPVALGRLAVVRSRRGVLVEAHRVRQLVRLAFDAHRHAELRERGHHTRVELRDGLRRQRHVGGGAVVGPDDETLMAKVEVHLERSRAVRHRPRREARGRHVQRHGPAVVEPRHLRQPDLAHDLQPQMQRGVRVAPRVERKRRPALAGGGAHKDDLHAHGGPIAP